MRLKDTLSALPGIFLLGLVGCGYIVSQTEEPTPTPATTISQEPTQSKAPEPSPATKPAAPKPSKNELMICGEIFEKTPVTNAIRSEVNRIREDHAYICDIDWDLFAADNTWGRAWTPSKTIEINEDFEEYRVFEDDGPEDLEFQVRETVRHEFGHQVIFQHFGMPGRDDAAIQKIFGDYQPDPLNGEVIDSYTADELAADVMAAVLNPDQDSPYVTRYDKDVLNSARAYLDETERIQ